ncbi:PulJ/GspJ family protein [Desulforegula conservatrix]|uniref:PulJ/GspJ family protein n=1 Tax=Desulforegula conservatrix TaxID=153026 RepID=UPI0022B50075|nr:prepilin-type N-terminal cleavage/methylation domain-containing protein [Desulforegula conservatrix]
MEKDIYNNYLIFKSKSCLRRVAFWKKLRKNFQVRKQCVYNFRTFASDNNKNIKFLRGLKELFQKVPQDQELQRVSLFRFSTSKGNRAKNKYPKISGHNGFTLMEVLIAVSLAAIIVAIVAGALNVGRRAWEKGSEKMEEQITGRWLEALIRRQIGSICFRQVLGKNSYPFEGNQKIMRFLSSASTDGGGGDSLYIVTYKIEPLEGSSNVRLVCEEENLAENLVAIKKNVDGSTENKRRKIIVPEALKIIFYFKETGSSKSQWVEAWPQATRYPAAVLIDILNVKNENLRLITSVEQKFNV